MVWRGTCGPAITAAVPIAQDDGPHVLGEEACDERGNAVSWQDGSSRSHRIQSQFAGR